MMGVGMAARFVPSYDESDKLSMAERRESMIAAKICYINWEHKFFMVEWDSNGLMCRESFKFSDIGKRVTVGGRKTYVHAENHRQ